MSGGEVADMHCDILLLLWPLIFRLLRQCKTQERIPRVAFLKLLPTHVGDGESWQWVFLIIQVGVKVLRVGRVLTDELVKIDDDISEEYQEEHCSTDETLPRRHWVISGDRDERKDVNLLQYSNDKWWLLLLDEWLFQQWSAASLLGLLFAHLIYCGLNIELKLLLKWLYRN